MMRTLLTFTFAWCLIQSAHMVEHVAQLVQKYVLGLPVARGFLGAIFDLEWVHLLYNGTLEVAILLILISWRRNVRLPLPFTVTAAAAFQGYHVVEHVVKMYQYYALGITVAPQGILGQILPLIWLHFVFNLVTLALVIGIWRSVRTPWSAQLNPRPA